MRCNSIPLRETALFVRKPQECNSRLFWLIIVNNFIFFLRHLSSRWQFLLDKIDCTSGEFLEIIWSPWTTLMKKAVLFHVKISARILRGIVFFSAIIYHVIKEPISLFQSKFHQFGSSQLRSPLFSLSSNPQLAAVTYVKMIHFFVPFCTEWKVTRLWNVNDSAEIGRHFFSFILNNDNEFSMYKITTKSKLMYITTRNME